MSDETVRPETKTCHALKKNRVFCGIQVDHRLKKLLDFDKNAHEFVVGNEAVGRSTGYKSALYATTKIYTDPTSRESLVDGGAVRSEQNSIAHWYFVNGEIVTHPDSGSVAGERARAITKDSRRAAVPGWDLPVHAPSKTSKK